MAKLTKAQREANAVEFQTAIAELEIAERLKAQTFESAMSDENSSDENKALDNQRKRFETRAELATEFAGIDATTVDRLRVMKIDDSVIKELLNDSKSGYFAPALFTALAYKDKTQANMATPARAKNLSSWLAFVANSDNSEIQISAFHAELKKNKNEKRHTSLLNTMFERMGMLTKNKIGQSIVSVTIDQKSPVYKALLALY